MKNIGIKFASFTKEKNEFFSMFLACFYFGILDDFGMKFLYSNMVCRACSPILVLDEASNAMTDNLECNEALPGSSQLDGWFLDGDYSHLPIWLQWEAKKLEKVILKLGETCRPPNPPQEDPNIPF